MQQFHQFSLATYKGQAIRSICEIRFRIEPFQLRPEQVGQRLYSRIGIVQTKAAPGYENGSAPHSRSKWRFEDVALNSLAEIAGTLKDVEFVVPCTIRTIELMRNFGACF